MEHHIVLKENVVAATVPVLRQMVAQALDAGVTRLVLNMEQVYDIDSVGLSVLIGVSMFLQRAGGGLEVYNVREDVFNILHSMRLDEHFQVRRLASDSSAPSSCRS